MRLRVLLHTLSILAIFLVGSHPVRAGALPSPEAPDDLTILVNNSLADAPDANPGDAVCETAAGNGVCTLRAAVMEANAYAGSDTIHLPAGTYTLTRVGEDDTAVNGDLDILEELTITGEGNDHTIIDANGQITQDRAFFIAVGVVAVIQGVRIQNGFTQLNGGGILNNGQLTLSNLAITDSHGNHGGAIASTAPLVIYDSLIVNNSAQYHGGGVINYDDLEMRGVTMSSNDAPDDGGAIYYISVDSNIRITNSSIFNNVADHGGALAGSAGRVLILGSRISGNSARFYGGALNLTDSVVDIYNTTISGNWTNGTGGAISIGHANNSLEDAINLYNTTIAGNKSNNDNMGSGDGGGIINVQSTVRMQNSILANNVEEAGVVDTPDDCAGEIISQGYNLIRITAGCTIIGQTTGNKISMDPILGSLADNGGPTHTLALQAGSPAIDAGNPAGCADALGVLLPYDQRGFLRHITAGAPGGRCDMGAFEFSSTPPIMFLLPLLVN